MTRGEESMQESDTNMRTYRLPRSSSSSCHRPRLAVRPRTPCGLLPPCCPDTPSPPASKSSCLRVLLPLSAAAVPTPKETPEQVVGDQVTLRLPLRGYGYRLSLEAPWSQRGRGPTSSSCFQQTEPSAGTQLDLKDVAARTSQFKP